MNTIYFYSFVQYFFVILLLFVILDDIDEGETFSFGVHKPKIFSIEEADYTNETIIFDSYRLVLMNHLINYDL